MGNRAVIVWRDRNGDVTPDSVGVYLHYNGGRDSVRAFLAYCEMCGFSNPAEDECDFARFVQIVANFLQGDGIGVACLRNLDTDGDNGVYVCDGWNIVERRNFYGPEQDRHELREMIRAINEAQPDAIRKSEDRLEKLLAEYMEKFRNFWRSTQKNFSQQSTRLKPMSIDLRSLPEKEKTKVVCLRGVQADPTAVRYVPEAWFHDADFAVELALVLEMCRDGAVAQLQFEGETIEAKVRYDAYVSGAMAYTFQFQKAGFDNEDVLQMLDRRPWMLLYFPEEILTREMCETALQDARNNSELADRILAQAACAGIILQEQGPKL